jgi:hypothetical protein
MESFIGKALVDGIMILQVLSITDFNLKYALKLLGDVKYSKCNKRKGHYLNTSK